MISYIKTLEEKFDTEIPHINKSDGGNYYDLDQHGNIVKLYLRRIEIKDLNELLPLAEHLVELALIYCKITTIRPLRYFSKLEKLSLRGNFLHASTLVHLSFLERLTKLDLSGCNIKDTSPLGLLTNLEELYIGSSDRLFEVNGLGKLMALEYLCIRNTQIDSIKKINANSTLRCLNLDGSDIEKITHLERFPYLEELSLATTYVTKIEGLTDLTHLKVLDLSDNDITKIEGLETLQNLKKLNLCRNNITKVENLDHLINLEYAGFEVNKNLIEFDTACLSNITSDCAISMRYTGMEEVERDIPKNVTIKFADETYVYPDTLPFRFQQRALF